MTLDGIDSRASKSYVTGKTNSTNRRTNWTRIHEIIPRQHRDDGPDAKTTTMGPRHHILLTDYGKMLFEPFKKHLCIVS